jgi:hypothetical protein
MSDEDVGHVTTSRRPRKLRDRARRAQRDGKSVVLLTLRDHQDGPTSVLFVSEPGKPGPAFSYFPQRPD